MSGRSGAIFCVGVSLAARVTIFTRAGDLILADVSGVLVKSSRIFRFTLLGSAPLKGAFGITDLYELNMNEVNHG